jgi:guanosine-3',5'-bis(diphosphate) 3'-pyrophosphohydrolase
MRQKALLFAADKHEGQFRKDDVTPYVYHCMGVADIVEEYGGDENQIIIAKLHDVIEDCDCTYEEILDQFGKDIADGVVALTNTSKQDRPDLNRAGRKFVDNTRLIQIAERYKFVKLADILYNVSDLHGLPQGFAVKFLHEKEEQARAVSSGSGTLYQEIIYTIEYQLNKRNQ